VTRLISADAVPVDRQDGGQETVISAPETDLRARILGREWEYPARIESSVASGPPVTEHRLDPATAAALGADGFGGILLRPDGAVWDPSHSGAARAGANRAA
jgi:hypothetical protein